MRPSPSLHYVSTLLDQRRRRHHRTRRLWGTGLVLLGLGLLLVGWWGTRRLAPGTAPQAAADAPAVRPARPTRTPRIRGIALEPHWERPVLLEPEACQACPCPTLAPGHAACTPSDGVELACSLLPGCVAEPSGRVWERTRPAPGAGPLPTAGTGAAPTPPEQPARADPPPAPRASPACGAAPCPAAPAVGRPAPSPARQPLRPTPRGRRRTGPRRPERPVLPPGQMSDDASPVLAEPERLTARP